MSDQEPTWLDLLAEMLGSDEDETFEDLRWYLLRSAHGSAVKDADQWQGLKQRRIERGLANISTAPFGYDLTGDGVEVPIWPSPTDAESAREVFRLYATGAHSTRTISAELVRRDMPYISNETIRDMLINPIYVGLMRVGYRRPDGSIIPRRERKVVPAAHPPIIGPALFYLVYRLTDEAGSASGRKQALVRSKRSVAVCQRTATCAYCGQELYLRGYQGRYRSDDTYAEYRIDFPSNVEDPGCVHCDADWGRGQKPVLAEGTLAELERFVRDRLNEWARQRLETVRALWDAETASVVQVARGKREEPEFTITSEALAREAALASVWVDWREASSQERCVLAHVALKAVPVDLPAGGLIDYEGITWHPPFGG